MFCFYSTVGGENNGEEIIEIKRNKIFRHHNEKQEESLQTPQRQYHSKKAKKLANLTYPIIPQSCNKITIGKTLWTRIVLPSVLCASSILACTKREIITLQRTENAAYRDISGASSYTQVPVLRGEIGTSAMETRMRQNQVNYLKYIENESNELMRGIVEETAIMSRDYWMKSNKKIYEGY